MRTARDGPDRRGYLALAILAALATLYWGLSWGRPGWNYAGPWSDIGNALLVGVLAVLSLGFLRPALRYVRGSIRDRPRDATTFTLLSAGGFAIWLIATGSVQLAAMGSGQQVSVVPVLSPFGLWPSLIFLWGTAGLQGYLSPAIVSVSVVSSLLWAAIMLRVWNARPTVPWASPRRTGPQSPLVWSALGAWLPTTAIGGSCCASPPIAFSVLGVILPNTAATVTGIELGGVAIPGVLYLLYFGTLLFLQRRSEPLSERCRQ